MLGIKFVFGDDESVNSADSRLEKNLVGDILSCVGRVWSVELLEPIKSAWRTRATWLNRRHLPGPQEVPRGLVQKLVVIAGVCFFPS